MKKKPLLLLFLLTTATIHIAQAITHHADWVVVGAGPAGIITVGTLLDKKVSAKKIIWLDPAFHVGRLGKYYQHVPSNTKTKHFAAFLKSCKSFRSCNFGNSTDNLYQRHPEKHCLLQDIVAPLKKLSTHLRTKVPSLVGTMESLTQIKDAQWLVTLQNKHDIKAKNVVLATGCQPKKLSHGNGNIISLDLALDSEKLISLVTKHDSIAVFGSSHSAMLVMKTLYEFGVAKIINFYKHPLKYAQQMNGWLLYKYTGLKTVAAQWAREILEKKKPANIVRIKSNQQNIEIHLPNCTKIIYAIGYERNPLPLLKDNTSYNYNKKTGIIAPGLFGIGFAFPSSHIDPHGNREDQIGLNSFFKHAKKIFSP